MKYTAFLKYVFIVLAVYVLPVSAATTTCSLETKDVIQENSNTFITEQQTKGITSQTSVAEIVKQLGPATSGTVDDAGYFLGWQLDDGRRFSVFSDGLCNQPMHAGIMGYTTAFLATPSGQLVSAINNDDLNQVQSVLSAHPEAVNGVEEGSSYSPLALAIRQNERNDALIEYLLKHGADAKFTTSEGYNLFHLNVDVDGVMQNGSEYKVAKLLLAHGADIEAVNHYGWTPLMRAAIEGSDNDFEALLKLGANFKNTFSQASMPEFTRGNSIVKVVLPKPNKVKLLLQYGYRPSSSDINAAQELIQQYTQDKGSDFYQRMSNSLSLLKKSQNKSQKPQFKK